MTARREFLDFGDGEENRSALFGEKTREGGVGAMRRGGAGRTPSQRHGRDVIWETQLTCGRDGLVGNSWRDSGTDSGIDLRRHELGPEDPGSALADLRFEIQREKSLKDITGQKGDQ